jgi:hypothetical protein
MWLSLQNYVYVRNISRHEYNQLKPILVSHLNELIQRERVC